MIAHQEKITGWNYQTDSVALVPYVYSADSVFPDELLIQVYFKLKSDKTLDILFPSINAPNLVEFVAYFKEKPIVVAVVLAGQEWKVMGLGWLWEVEGPKGARKASCAYAFFREFWGRDEIRQVARLALKYWFTEFGVSIIYGAAMKSNLRAQRFDREMGFKKDAELRRFFIKNGVMHDAVIVSMTHEEFSAGEGQ